jgi:hypothetical protein
MIPVSAKVEQLQDGQIHLKTTDGQTFRLPETAVHGTPTVGSELRLIGVVGGTEANGEGPLAHALLNELLGFST